METLYILGNGFDLHHRLDTKYSSFGLYVKEHYPNVYDQLIEFYGFCDLTHCDESTADRALWSDFENDLSKLDTESVMESLSQFIANPGGEDFRDRDWGAYSIEVSSFVDKLLNTLFSAFKEFIFQVEYPTLEQRLLLDFSNAHLISFNYTNTLQAYYGVNDSKINYIHGKAASESSELVLGHAIPAENFIDDEQSPPPHLTDEELELWEQCMSDRYDYSVELARDELQGYFSSTFKPTNDIIEANEFYFNQLSGVDTVYILGHSLADVDLPYFEKLISSVSAQSVYHTSYYLDHEKMSHLDRLKQLGVAEEKISMTKISELPHLSQLKLI
ncbi:bacteriophage abortive infection AbiH family protein [Cellvibrio sp. KY-YJ-3]|uniref:bacteriophage abortive infection AbiH family protein n=1 Tax=Cellvibrio sp. KY-YJ-3 TaxID=454662 RepID=UPI0017812A29|nr:bacteriophage abortive infection AbiH family protein [Cellvibrio sp. KY-YJ-3]